MINLYNPDVYFKDVDISEIRQWADLSYCDRVYEENNQFCIISTVSLGSLAIVLYSTFDQIPKKFMQALNSEGYKLIISTKYLEGFTRLKNPARIDAFSETWDMEFNFYAYT